MDQPALPGERFPTWLARLNGVSRGRLRSRDLAAPFFGVRVPSDAPPPVDTPDPYERQRRLRVHRAQEYLPGLHFGHHFSHETAASIWGAPLPLAWAPDGGLAGAEQLPLHVSAIGHVAIPRARGVTGHRTLLSMTARTVHDGMRVSSPAATWVVMGHLPVFDLVALGDYFCRRWRTGAGRPDAGKPPLATIDELRGMLAAGRRRGADRLRTALELIREDSWSPRESLVRCILVAAGLPEPELNVDVFDDDGRFLGCIDMVFRRPKVAVEYLGMLHGASWAADVERLARLRAAGWTVIEVTAPLLRRPGELVERVRRALGAFE